MLKQTYQAFASVNKNHSIGNNLWFGNGQYFIGITMPDNKTEWYVADAQGSKFYFDVRFPQDIAKLLKESHEDMAHLYALERVVKDSSTAEEVALWKAVLTLLDKEK